MQLPSLPARSAVYGSIAWASTLALGIVAAVNIVFLVAIGIGLIGE